MAAHQPVLRKFGRSVARACLPKTDGKHDNIFPLHFPLFRPHA